MAYHKNLLIDLKAILLGMLARNEKLAIQISVESAPVELDQTRVGRLSRMDALQGQALAGASKIRQQKERAAPKSALEKLENGEFGRCEECDQFIAIERMRVNPTTLYCIRCATLLEK